MDRFTLKRLEDVQAELVKAQQENDTLRGLLANGSGPCVYCSLPAEEINKCAHGFPGCPRMDDIVNAPETETQLKLQNFSMKLIEAASEVNLVFLRTEFPWLLEEDTEVSGADTVDRLVHIHDALTKRETERGQSED